MKKISVLLFNDFETLDVFGPVEIFGILKEDYQITFYSLSGGLIRSSQEVTVMTEKISNLNETRHILLIPGGWGTRPLVNDASFIEVIRNLAEKSQFVLTVCTGSALLAKTGLLSGKNATTNKRAFDWVMKQDESVCWKRQARWVVDDKFYSSSGVSAGMDMALGFIGDFHGLDFARKLAYRIEYTWQEAKDVDPFWEQENLDQIKP
jgi:putative intracellular protease/amidase